MKRGVAFVKAAMRDRALIGQLIRFGITGGGVTALGLVAYWLLAKPAHVPAGIANILSWVVSVVTGYTVHSSWSFKGHGSRADPHRIRFRFLCVALLSLAANAFWVELLVVLLHGPVWWPMPAMAIATPLITFPLNRRWVFR